MAIDVCVSCGAVIQPGQEAMRSRGVERAYHRYTGDCEAGGEESADALWFWQIVTCADAHWFDVFSERTSDPLLKAEWAAQGDRHRKWAKDAR